jgi:hypothetical protein
MQLIDSHQGRSKNNDYYNRELVIGMVIVITMENTNPQGTELSDQHASKVSVNGECVRVREAQDSTALLTGRLDTTLRMRDQKSEEGRAGTDCEDN